METDINSRVQPQTNTKTYNSKKSCIIGVFILIIFVILLELIFHFSEQRATALYNTYMKNEILIIRNFTKNKESNPTIKNILYWNTFCGLEDMGLGLGDKIFEKCQFSACSATNNRSLIPVEKFDAIIFDGVRYMKSDEKPKTRSKHQKYIFLSQEIPNPLKNMVSKNFYNWTMTFRKDSDIYYRCGTIKRIYDSNYTIPTYENVNKKKKMAAWFVKKCKTEDENTTEPNLSKNRLQNIQKFLNIDIYESCDKVECQNSDEKNCLEMLEKDYYFYWSFGNAVCDYFVPNKLFDVLNYNVVPIRYGSLNYYAITAPYGSMIDVSDFRDPVSLAHYLFELSSNYTEYIKFFEWKKHYHVSSGHNDAMCQLCEKLHTPLEYSHYEDINLW